MFKGFLRAQLRDGTRTSVIVVGLDDATLFGGPTNLTSGDLSMLRQDPGIFIDERDAGTKLAGKLSGDTPMRLGDRLSINDNDAVVLGTFKASPSFFWDPVVYTTFSRAVRFAPKERRLMSFVLVKVKQGADINVIKKQIEANTPFIAKTTAEFEASTRDYILKSTGILVNFGMAIGLGFIIGMLITGQTFFNFTLDNLRYYAALKALGASTSTLVQMVLVQVLSVTWISFGLGVGIASLMGIFIVKTDLAFLMKWQTLVMTAVAMLVVGVLAAMLSLIKVLRLEPAVVFKGA